MKATTNNELVRANRVTVKNTAEGFVAEFFRTHKHVGTMKAADTDWKAVEGTTATAQREDFRTWAQVHADEIGIAWSATQAEQAWERKHKKYFADEQVEEDATTLLQSELARVIKLTGKDAKVVEISLDFIAAADGDRPYCTKGKYDKDNAWAWADFKMAITLEIEGKEVELTQPMQIVSGQIKKVKMRKEDVAEVLADEEIA